MGGHKSGVGFGLGTAPGSGLGSHSQLELDFGLDLKNNYFNIFSIENKQGLF